MPWRQKEWKCSYNNFEPQHYIGVNAQRHALSALPPKKARPWHLNRRLCGLQIRCREANYVSKIAQLIA